jgi:hypothetical protein
MAWLLRLRETGQRGCHTPPDACCRVFVAGGYLLATFALAEAQHAVQERLEATRMPGKRGAFPNI